MRVTPETVPRIRLVPGIPRARVIESSHGTAAIADLQHSLPNADRSTDKVNINIVILRYIMYLSNDKRY